MPHYSTLQHWAQTIQPETLQALNDRVVVLARQAKWTTGRKLRIDGTVVETTIHHPTDSSLPGVLGTVVLACTPGVAPSTGSACHSGDTAPSSVLTAMGLAPERALGAVRLSLGRWTTEEEIRAAAALLADGYRHVSSLYAAF